MSVFVILPHGLVSNYFKSKILIFETQIGKHYSNKNPLPIKLRHFLRCLCHLEMRTRQKLYIRHTAGSSLIFL